MAARGGSGGDGGAGTAGLGGVSGNGSEAGAAGSETPRRSRPRLWRASCHCANLAVGGQSNFALGGLDLADCPQELRVRWIRVWQSQAEDRWRLKIED